MTKSTLTAFAAILCLFCPALLQAATYGAFTYTVTNSEVTITDYTGSATNLTIPDTINGYPVTTIGERAFYECSSLTSINIPNSVTSIGDRAFYNCADLTSITIPDNVTSIGEWAFFDCIGLTSIILGDSVTSIGYGAFYGCYSLTRATFLGDAPTMGSYVFYGTASGFCIYYPAAATGYTGSPWSGYTLHSYTITAGPSWSDSFESVTSPGWYDSSWYGWFYTEDSWGGGIYSVTNGWQYVFDLGGNNGIVTYDYASACWWFTSEGFYPYMYNYTTASWYFYIDGTTPSRTFWSYSSGSVVDESNL